MIEGGRCVCIKFSTKNCVKIYNPLLSSFHRSVNLAIASWEREPREKEILERKGDKEREREGEKEKERKGEREIKKKR